MFKNIEKIFKSLVLINFFISVLITLKVFINYFYNNSSEISIGLLITFIYALSGFIHSIKYIIFQNSDLRIYISLTFLGFLFNILSNLSYLDKIIYLLTVTEHMIIGSILTFTYFSKIKSKFK